MTLGLGFVGIAFLDLSGRRWTRRLFAYSIAYLAALFGVLAITPFVG